MNNNIELIKKKRKNKPKIKSMFCKKKYKNKINNFKLQIKKISKI